MAQTLNAIARPGIEGRDAAELIRVRGLVQGVGFRPTVWHLARRFGLRGWVANDGDGVLIRVRGPDAAIAGFVGGLREEAPLLARIDRIERTPSEPSPEDAAFRIADSVAMSGRTGVAPDAATCPQCRAEVFDPSTRRYRYPFTNCTHCGPRLSIVDEIPYDRHATTMRAFDMCAACAREYRSPDDRRFHAQPIACHACGPRAWLEFADGRAFASDAVAVCDDIEAAAILLMQGQILAIKGLGGFQLACDATDAEAVGRLRTRKRRPAKALALMVRDLGDAGAYCEVSEQNAALLSSAAAPIVILVRHAGGCAVADNVAPGLNTLGVMLPSTPLHHLLLQCMDRPIVLTSGNFSDEPQCIDNAEARQRLGDIADYLLLHDRDIAHRIDDSVVRTIRGTSCIMRRARGYAPAPLKVPEGFAAAPPVLAMGGELKAAFCLLRGGEAILSHHLGDLENARSFADYAQSIDEYLALFDHAPTIVATDHHPDYLSTTLGCDIAARDQAEIVEVQHHHAHIAACMAENGVALDAGAVFGVALDGLGYGLDGTLWGGEFLLADYRVFRRLATFKPVAMPGGAQAIREPWRNTFAHLAGGMGWPRFVAEFGGTALHRMFQHKPCDVLDGMIARGANSPLASSCGRLFDAVADAVGVCADRAEYEGQAAAEFEALVDTQVGADKDAAGKYPFAIGRLASNDLRYLEPLPMWQALLADLVAGVSVPAIAARFHNGLAAAIVRMIDTLRRDHPGVTTVALSGGVMQNRVLLEGLISQLEALGLSVMTHTQVPANDGGLALGQAVIAAARALGQRQGRGAPCA